MTNQTPRQQLDDILYRFSRYVEHHARTGRGQGDDSYTQPIALDAILAIFKGLPAMQEEHYKADDPRHRIDSEPFEWAERNDLRRQILAELEENHD